MNAWKKPKIEKENKNKISAIGGCCLQSASVSCCNNGSGTCSSLCSGRAGL